jgi:uncharacterized glyoxalase superfamily protein PhnB
MADPSISPRPEFRATTPAGEPMALGEHNGFEVYPMPMFATLTVDDVAGLSRWYEQALGFRTMFAAPGPGGQPSLVHLRRRKYQDLLIAPSRPGATAPPSSLTLTFQADDDIEAIAAQARSVAAVDQSAIEGPTNTPWNTRDLRVTDPVGHRIVLTARRTDADPAQVARMQALIDQSRTAR